MLKSYYVQLLVVLILISCACIWFDWCGMTGIERFHSYKNNSSHKKCESRYTEDIVHCKATEQQTKCRESKKEAFSSGTMMHLESNRGSRTDSYLTGLNNPHTAGYAEAKRSQTDKGYDLNGVKRLPVNLIGWTPNVTDNRRYLCSKCR